ncbi:MAG: DUF3418 domain-containing protein, partial [Propionibacteriaceae bacterium]|nr:DUF3418 domain-containing protein [Propionibacteriaceae bacterium]
AEQTAAGGYLALADQFDDVAVRVFEHPLAALRSQAAGLRRLIALTTPDTTRWVLAYLSNADKLALAVSPYASPPELLADARLAAIGAGIAEPWEIRSQPAFAALRDVVRRQAADRHLQTVRLAGVILRLHQQLLEDLANAPPETAADIREQLRGLLFPGFLSAAESRWLARYPVYLRAAALRVRHAKASPFKDATKMEEVLDAEDAYAKLTAKYPPGLVPDPVLRVGWLLEEFRVQVFAQALGTVEPVSLKRLRVAMDAIQ